MASAPCPPYTSHYVACLLRLFGKTRKVRKTRKNPVLRKIEASNPVLQNSCVEVQQQSGLDSRELHIRPQLRLMNRQDLFYVFYLDDEDVGNYEVGSKRPL